MPRYFFHILNGPDATRDPEGQDLPGVEAAREEAIASARELLAAKIIAGETVDGESFEVCDEEDNVVFSLRFKDVLQFSR